MCLICNVNPKKAGQGQRFCSNECAEIAKLRRKKNSREYHREKSAKHRLKKGQAVRPKSWDDQGRRRCPWGDHFVDLSEFKGGYCNNCRPLSQRDNSLRRKYGITLDDYVEMWNSQNGECAICQEKKSRLDVDHCHETGRVRGLLCMRCNYNLLGCVKDDVNIIRRAVEYLEEN